MHTEELINSPSLDGLQLFFHINHYDSSDGLKLGASLGMREGASDGILEPQSRSPSSPRIQSNRPSTSSRAPFFPFPFFPFLPFLPFLPFFPFLDFLAFLRLGICWFLDWFWTFCWFIRWKLRWQVGSGRLFARCWTNGRLR